MRIKHDYGFSTWLLGAYTRKDPVGDIARDVLSDIEDGGFPPKFCAEQLEERMDELGAIDLARRAFDEALVEYQFTLLTDDDFDRVLGRCSFASGDYDEGFCWTHNSPKKRNDRVAPQCYQRARFRMHFDELVQVLIGRLR